MGDSYTMSIKEYEKYSGWDYYDKFKGCDIELVFDSDDIARNVKVTKGANNLYPNKT